MAIDLSTYKDVAARLADLKALYPNATLQPLNLESPFKIITVGDQTFVVYVAACYRTPDDPRPGIGVAWEPFPGKTNYTRTSELMNAETSAWGRAIVATLASESRAIASAEEVRNRSAENDEEGHVYGRGEKAAAGTTDAPTANQVKFLHAKANDKGLSEHDLNELSARLVGTNVENLSKVQASRLIDAVLALP